MKDLVPNSVTFIVFEAFNVLKVGRVLSDEGSFSQQRFDIGQCILIGKLLNVTQKCFLRDISEGILDPAKN